ncbi:MAG: histidine phosphatase family protein [Clostridia bacterium]|nr:histidine phosphatase family protein [Clostridia bacterium]
MITLILVRHGESIANLQLLRSGQTDFALSELGYRQADMTADYLKDTYPIDVIYASDLSRTMATAAPTARALGLEIRPDKELREINAGIWEGISRSAPIDMDLFQAWMNDGAVAPEGGETHRHMRARVNAEVDRILAENPGKCVALFTHWGVIQKIIQRWWTEKPELKETYEKVPFCNSSVTVAEYHDNGTLARIRCVGYADHLGGMITSTGKYQI